MSVAQKLAEAWCEREGLEFSEVRLNPRGRPNKADLAAQARPRLMRFLALENNVAPIMQEEIGQLLGCSNQAVSKNLGR